jgi:hypothetical protein
VESVRLIELIFLQGIFGDVLLLAFGLQGILDDPFLFLVLLACNLILFETFKALGFGAFLVPQLMVCVELAFLVGHFLKETIQIVVFFHGVVLKIIFANKDLV